MNENIYKHGYRSAMAAFLATVLFFIVQSLQLLGVLVFPWDQILIYGFSLCIVVPFLLAILALHYAVPAERKFRSHAALLFTLLYAVFVTANYVVQLATVIPAMMNGRENEVHLLTQYPHSLFWDFDAAGYICMGLATLSAAPLFGKQGKEKWVRYVFFIHACVTPLIAFVYFYPDFSDSLLLWAIPWGITAPASMLVLALWFRKKWKQS